MGNCLIQFFFIALKHNHYTMKYLLLFAACCCVLWACGDNNAERDKKIEAAIKADMQLHLLKEDMETMDSFAILSVQPITTSRDLELRMNDKKIRLHYAKKDIEGNNNQILDEQNVIDHYNETLRVYPGDTSSLSGLKTSQEWVRKWKGDIAKDSVAIINYKREVDSLQLVQVKDEKPAGYLVSITYTVESKRFKHLKNKLTYLVTEDMQAMMCHQ